MKAPASRSGPAPLLAILLILSSAAGAQADGGVQLRVGPILSNVLSDSERESLEKMVASYASDILDATAALERSLDGASLPEIRVTGEVAVVDGDLVFTLGKAVGTGEDASVSEVCVSVNEVVLKARDLTRRLLGMASSPAPSALPPASTRPADIRSLAGTWRGDTGMDKVRIYPEGRAVATLSNGVAMALSVSEEDGRIVFSQAEASSWRFYQSAAWSMATAREIASKARPMRWIMVLSEDGKRLVGVKESSAVSREADGALIVDNGYSRPASWERLY